jgi:cysteine desulfurase
MNSDQNSRIYLDYHATTPVDPCVLNAMQPFFSDTFGNAASHQHAFGWDAKNALESARKQVAGLVGALPREITFTSSVTENMNWIVRALREELLRGESVHAVTSVVEHSATRETFKALENWGASVTWLGVDKFGCIDPAELKKALTPRTRLVSLIYGHNELGSVNDLDGICGALAGSNVWLHLDCAQALTTQQVDVSTYPIDLLSISGHKMYAPKGVAALYQRSRPKRVRLEPLLIGGSQESGLRASTVPTALAVGLGEACKIAAAERDQWVQTWAHLAQEFRQGLVPLGAQFNGLSPKRLPQSVSVTFPVMVDQLFPALAAAGIAVSSGSACGPQDGPSPALLAIGLSREQALSTLRFCLGRSTTPAQLKQVTEVLKNAISKVV